MTADHPPLPSDQDSTGRQLGEEEIQRLADVIRSGTLTSTRGTQVKQLQEQLAGLFGVKYAYACTSGTAAIHTAVAAINPEPGDEIITTSVTDMGALTPILYQGAIPVFADIDPHTYNVTAETIEARLSERTRAIIVTHLFGNPCEMDRIMAVADKAGVPVIEDAAQAYLARSQGQLVGTAGAIGCFSLQQGKHITTGEGGFVLTDDDALARRMFLFINKAWGYGDAKPDHYFLSLNYRTSELEGAVAVAQLGKLPAAVEHRRAMAAMLTESLGDIEEIETPVAREGDEHTYWRYALRVSDMVGGPTAMATALKELGVPSGPRYIQKPAFQCQVFAEQRTFGDSRWPFTLARPEAVDYTPQNFPGTFDALNHVLVLPFNDRFMDQHVRRIADAVKSSIQNMRQEQLS